MIIKICGIERDGSLDLIDSIEYKDENELIFKLKKWYRSNYFWNENSIDYSGFHFVGENGKEKKNKP